MAKQQQLDWEDKLQNHLQTSERSFVFHMKTLGLSSQQRKALSAQYRNALLRTVTYIFLQMLERQESTGPQSIQPWNK
jgi:hypothetical protein